MGAALTILIDGLTYASWLFIVALGLTLVFGVLKILNMAHGSFYAIGVTTDSRHPSDAAGTMSSDPPRRCARIDTASCTSTLIDPHHDEGATSPSSEVNRYPRTCRESSSAPISSINAKPRRYESAASR